ncbi:MAG: hypothetical protein ACN4G0_16230 [Polyangiales bacterium]
MFSTIGKVTMNHDMLGELASSGALSDPVLFVYGVLGCLAFAGLTIGYALFGRPGAFVAR